MIDTPALRYEGRYMSAEDIKGLADLQREYGVAMGKMIEAQAEIKRLTAERDELAQECTRLQDDGTAYQTGYQRADDLARAAIEQARAERDGVLAENAALRETLEQASEALVAVQNLPPERYMLSVLRADEACRRILVEPPNARGAEILAAGHAMAEAIEEAASNRTRVYGAAKQWRALVGEG